MAAAWKKSCHLAKIRCHDSTRTSAVRHHKLTRLKSATDLFYLQKTRILRDFCGWKLSRQSKIHDVINY
jgi:hypothetical protein